MGEFGAFFFPAALQMLDTAQARTSGGGGGGVDKKGGNWGERAPREPALDSGPDCQYRDPHPLQRNEGQ